MLQAAIGTSSSMILVVLLAAGSALAGDWPNWRGPNYNGHCDGEDFKTTWTSPPETVWQQPLGPGYSGITCVDGKVYTCGMSEHNQILYCFDAESGKVLWKTPFEPPYRNNVWNGTRSTPTIDDGRAYVVGALGTVACFNANTGSKIWTRRFDRAPQWGYAGSVLINGKFAIVCVGGREGAMRALDKKSGLEIWKCGKDRDSGYSTPYPFTINGMKYICGLLGNTVVIAEPKSGREVFSMPWETKYKVNAATPIVQDGFLFLTSGYETGCGLYRLTLSGNKIEADEVWRSKKMRNKFQTPVLYKGKLYSFDQKSFKCMDFKSGKIEWEKRGGANAYGSTILANGFLITLTQEGLLRIGRASANDFTPSAEAQILDGQCWTVPTLSHGLLYARNHDRIVCIDLRK